MLLSKLLSELLPKLREPRGGMHAQAVLPPRVRVYFVHEIDHRRDASEIEIALLLFAELHQAF
jgi:hypothetical protein